MAVHNLTIEPIAEEDMVEVPHLGAVSLASSSGAFVTTIETLSELNEQGIGLSEIVDALKDAREEQENLYAMAVLTTATTGIYNTIYLIPVPHGRHGPRLKVMLDPPRAKRPGGNEATVPFDTGTKPPVDVELEQQLRRFIEINRPALLAYWQGETATDEFISQLRPI
jgi:hypothetical protein